MEDSESLDSFISATSNVSAPEESAVTPAQISGQPKLRKIKRAKIRPQMVAPEVPQKIESISTISSENQTEENMDILASSTENQSPSIDEQVTDLVKYSQTQNITEEIQPNSHVFGELPSEFEYPDEMDEEAFIDTSLYIKKSVFYLSTLSCLFVGFFLGKVFFSSQVIEHHGLEGVVTNPDVPAGRPRCGLTDKSQACILYIMNWYRQELNGRDFYKLAAQLTGREEYMIDTDNLRYSNVKIKAGQIAQLNIPALK